MIPVSIVLPSFNREPLLRQTLRTIFAQRYEPLEVIVVDDGSTDDTRKLRDEFPIRYFYLDRPTWTNPSRACNVGIRAATHPNLILQGAEMEHAPLTIAKFAQHIHENPKDWVFATVYDIDERGRGKGQLSGPARTSHAWFLSAIRTEHLLKIRGFDEDYDKPAYDDSDLADRLVKYGMRPTYRKDISGNHQYHPRNHSIEGTQEMARLYRAKTTQMSQGELGVVRNIEREWGVPDFPEGKHPLDVEIAEDTPR